MTFIISRYTNPTTLVVTVCCLLFSCSEKENKSTTEKPDFLQKKSQKADKRNFEKNIVTVDSLKLSNYGLFGSGHMEITEDRLYVYDYESHKLVAFDKNDFTKKIEINFSKGKGPREFGGVNDLSVNQSKILLGDPDLKRLSIWQHPKKFQEVINLDVDPHRVELMGQDRYLIYSTSFNTKYIFSILNSKGKVLRQFEQMPKNHNPLAYEGHIEVEDNHIYYAGHAEPVLKKYDAKGNLKYSVSTIDYYFTKANYVTPTGDSKQKLYTYSQYALFSSNEFDIYKDYWAVVPHSNDHSENVEDFYYLDFYNKGDGKYITSFDLDHTTGEVRVDDQFIFLYQKIDDEYYLKVLENDLQERLN